MRTLDEYRRNHPERPKASVNPSFLHTVAQEAVRMEALTGDENWDHFLSYIEAAARAGEAQLRIEDVKLRNPYLVNDQEIRALKVHIARIEARIDTLKEILALPKFIKERGAFARTQIADLAQGA